jgi:hypothetical protein
MVAAARVPRPTLTDPKSPWELERIVLKALAREADERHVTAAALESELREFLQTHHIVVPRSGIAGLLQRVMGPRIEQRRRAVRQNLLSLERSKYVTQEELPAADPSLQVGDWSVQTGSDPSFASNPSGVSSLSQVGPVTRTSRPEAVGGWRGPLVALLLAALGAGLWLYQSRWATTLSSNTAAAPDVAPPKDTTHAAPALPPRPSAPPAASQDAEVGPRPGIPVVDIDELEPERELHIADAGPPESPSSTTETEPGRTSHQSPIR